MSQEPNDRQFEELMAREFPEGLVPRLRGRMAEREQPAAGPSADPAAPATGSTGATDGGGFRQWTPPPEPDEPFVAPPAPPARRWSPAGIAGTALVSTPVLLALAAAFGFRPSTLVSVLVGAAFFVGSGLLLLRLRRRPPTDGDGAVV